MTPTLAVLRAFIRRDWTIARSYRFGFALQAFDTLLLLATYFFVGHLVNSSSLARKTGLRGHGYFSFVLVGLVLFEIMHVGLRSFALRIREDQLNGTLEAVFTTPAPQGLVVLAGAAYDLVRAAVFGVLLLIVGLFASNLDLLAHGWSPPVVFVALSASIAFFASVGVAIGGLTVLVKQVSTLTAFVSTGLSVLGGVYFPVSVLPGPLHALAKACPLTWGLDVLRGALLGGSLPTAELILLLATAVLAVPISVLIFSRCLLRAKQNGSLAQY